MDGLSVASSVTGLISFSIQVTETLVKYYMSYKNQKDDINHIFKKLETLLGLLEILSKQTSDRKFRAGEQDLLGRIEGSIQACEEFIQDLQEEAEKFQSKPAGGVRAAARTAAYKVAYPFRQSTLQKLDEDIDEVISHLSLALQLLGQNDIHKIQSDIDDAKALLELVRADQISSTLREWLKAPDATINYNEASKKRHSGTGLWLVKGSAFSAWLMKSNSLLWLYGFAGCGKSVLCSTTIHYAFRHRRSNPRVGISFFFFTFNDDTKQSCSAMLRSLVLQLSGQLNDNHGYLSRLHDSYRNTMPPDQALMNCLRLLIQAFDDVYIILDALDESPRDKYRGDVLEALVDIRAWSEPGLHLLMTSRDEPDIRDVLANELNALSEEMISIKNDFVDSDIAAFVSSALQNNRQLRKWAKNHDQIEKALTERANGVFRWVECQFLALSSCASSKKQLDQLLTSLPPDLDKTYERILLNIREESKDDARRVLTMLCSAKNPLLLSEVIEGIAVEIGDQPRFDIDGRLDNPDDIHQICPGLIETDFSPDYESDNPTYEIEPTVRIAHFSVQEYLESSRIHQQGVSFFSVGISKANAEMASICLTYLMELPSDLTEWEYPLKRYAARNWYEHYHDADRTFYNLDDQVLCLFRNTAGKLEQWLHLWSADEYCSRGSIKDEPPLVYYASVLGLDSIILELLAEKSSMGFSSEMVSKLLNSRGGRYETSLIAASFSGHEKTVQVLLNNGADINAKDGHYGTALMLASERGHEKTVQILLDHGADVNAKSDYSGTALNVACEEGHGKIVQLLLDKGADVNGQDKHGDFALLAASQRGHVDVVRQLLDRGADVNQRDDYWGSALVAASDRETVQLLLDRGADPNVQGDARRSALHRAAVHSRVGVIKAILAADNIQPSLLNDFQRPPAFYAAQAGSIEVVELLLNEHRTDVNLRDQYGTTVLLVAVRSGHDDVVKFLISIPDIDINVKDNFGRTPLSWAVKLGMSSMVDVLTKKSQLSSPAVQSEISRLDVRMRALADWPPACRICMGPFRTGDVSYRCEECCNGDFFMCSNCLEVGARCLDDTHELKQSEEQAE